VRSIEDNSMGGGVEDNSMGKGIEDNFMGWEASRIALWGEA